MNGALRIWLICAIPVKVPAMTDAPRDAEFARTPEGDIAWFFRSTIPIPLSCHVRLT
jgi:hypothetical protein